MKKIKHLVFTPSQSTLKNRSKKSVLERVKDHILPPQRAETRLTGLPLPAFLVTRENSKCWFPYIKKTFTKKSTLYLIFIKFSISNRLQKKSMYRYHIRCTICPSKLDLTNRNLLYKMGQDIFDIQYVAAISYIYNCIYCMSRYSDPFHIVTYYIKWVTTTLLTGQTVSCNLHVWQILSYEVKEINNH